MSLLVWTLLVPLVAQAPAPAQGRGSTLTLEAAIREALVRSPALDPARESLALAEIGEARARSEFGLRVTPSWTTTSMEGVSATEVGMTASRKLPAGTTLALSGDFLRSAMPSGDWSSGYALTISQPLLSLVSPETKARVRDAERGVVSAGRALQESRRELVVRVAQAYFAVARQQRLADAARRALDRANALKTASEARTKVGLATRLDVLRADLLASQASAQLEGQLEALSDHLDQLKVLLGRALDEPIAIDPAAGAGPAGIPSAAIDVDALVTSAIASRLDVSEMRDRVDDARRAASVSRWNLMPGVTIEATYTGRAAGALPFVPDLQRPGWRVRAGAAYAFDRAGAKATLASADLAAQAAERRLEDFARAVEADVRRAARAVDRATASIAIQEKARALAEQQLALAEMRYERGLAGNFDVIDAEANLFQAESALIAAQVDRAMAALLLEKASGQLDPGRYLR